MKAVFLDFDTVDAGDLDTATLRAAAPGLAVFGATTREQIGQRVSDAEVIITNKVPIDRGVFDAAPRLGLVCLSATGTDRVDLGAARERGVAVCNAVDYCSDSVVQHVYALILSLMRRLDNYQRFTAGGYWSGGQPHTPAVPPPRELGGRRLGIVGFGALGKAVGRVAPAFGLQVVVSARPGAAATANRPSFEDVLATCDIVTLHCPLTDDTRNLIDAAALDRMKPDALLINTARGGLVDSNALARALREGSLGGAGIDVLPTEPPLDGDPLLADDIPNLIVTPHVAWASRRARQRALDEIAANIRAFRAGEKRNRVDLDA